MSETASLHIPRALECLPLYLLLAYLGATVAIFFAGPIAWPIEHQLLLVLFLCLALVGIVGGYLGGLSSPPAGAKFAHWRRVLLIGVAAAILTLFPSAYVYTGKMPWQIVDALRDQSATYAQMLDRLTEVDSLERGPVILMRTLAFPFVFAVVPLAVLNWQHLSWGLRLGCAAAALCSIAFSILRGTDREMFDLLLVTFSASLLAYARVVARTGVSWSSARRHLHLVLLGLLAVAAVCWVFIDRKAERTGDVAEMCIGDICADYTHPLLIPLNEQMRFGASMFAAYSSQGYYGLALALQKDFRSTMGVGHSLPLARLYTHVTGDHQLYERSYTFRLRDDDWSDESQWSTLFTWLANDVGFPGALLLVAAFSWQLAGAWKDAVGRGDDRAAVVFTLLAVLFFYLPANHQLAQTLDAYVTFVAWTTAWIAGRHRMSGSTPG